ncbi:MAG: hypothetical protein CMN76_01390 [Spirochaetaceae bacterium]|nr:hypothetical protein [Spirochaetaceae bacterium]
MARINAFSSSQGDCPLATKKAAQKNSSLPPDPEKRDLSQELERASGRLHSLFVQLPHLLGVSRSDVLLMHSQIDDGSRIKSLPYWMFVISSCGIATLGLIINSPAVIIGAMLVSPLMAPIIGLGMSVAISDVYLGLKSIVNIVLSSIVAVLTAAAITYMVPINELTPEILSRTSPTFLDLFIALFCGLVAALSSVRSDGEAIMSSVAPGAAIGVALMPPICVVGYGLGTGFSAAIMWGAFLLFVTNLSAIVMVSSVFYYFVYEGYNIQRLIRLLVNRREKTEPLFRLLGRQGWWVQVNEWITSSKRFLFPVILLALISYPLISSLAYLKEKIDIRNHVSEQLSNVQGMSLIRGIDGLVFNRNDIKGTIVYSSAELPGADFQEKLNQTVEKRFPEYNSRITLVRIARESDLSTLRKTQELTLDTSPETFHDAIRNRHATELVERAQSLVQARFPKKAGVILETRVIYSAEGMDRVVVDYAGEPMPRETRELLEETLTRALQALKGDLRTLELNRVSRSKRTFRCDSEAQRQVWRQELRDDLRRLRNNPYLRIRIYSSGLQTEIKESISQLPQSDAKRIEASSLPEQRGCRVDLEYLSA